MWKKSRKRGREKKGGETTYLVGCLVKPKNEKDNDTNRTGDGGKLITREKREIQISGQKGRASKKGQSRVFLTWERSETASIDGKYLWRGRRNEVKKGKNIDL